MDELDINTFDNKSTAPEPKTSELKAAIICLILGCIIVMISPWGFLIYGALFFASFVLSIVAMSRSKIGGGISTMIASIILPFLFFFISVGIHTAVGINAMEESAAEVDDVTDTEAIGYADSLQISEFEAAYYDDVLDGETAGVRLKVQNQGSRVVSSVRIAVYFRDQGGDVIFEKELTPFSTESFMDADPPLRPNYIWSMDERQFYKIKGVPSEWDEGNATIEIIDVNFEED